MIFICWVEGYYGRGGLGGGFDMFLKVGMDDMGRWIICSLRFISLGYFFVIIYFLCCVCFFFRVGFDF